MTNETRPRFQSLKGDKPANEPTATENFRTAADAFKVKDDINFDDIEKLGATVRKAQVERIRSLAAKHGGEIISNEDAILIASQIGGMLAKDEITKNKLIEKLPNLKNLIDWLWTQDFLPKGF